MWLCLGLNLLLGSALLAGVGIILARHAKSRQAGRKNEAEEPYEAKRRSRELIESNAELQSLYEKLGYSAWLDRESKLILTEMKASIRTVIPDFAAFTQALNDLRKKATEPAAKEQYQAGDNELLGAVLAAGDEQTRILELLNRNPVYEQLPFVEQIPINKNGEIIWRTPLEHSLIRKRPVDPPRFAELLDQLESLFKEARTPQSRQIQREVIEAIGRTRRDLQKETAYMPTSLQALEKKVAEYILQSPSAASQTKIKQLDAWVEELIGIEHRCGLVVSESDISSFKKAAQQQAKTYLDSPWMHTPWLSTRMLTTLLDAEVAALPKEVQAAPTSTAAVLKVVRDEVSLGSYDNDETIRRLRQQEERGLFVNSLVYPLLRLHTAPQANIKKATT